MNPYMKRRSFTKNLALSTMGVFAANTLKASSASGQSKKIAGNWTLSQMGGNVKISAGFMDEPLKVMFIADSHICCQGGLAEPYLDYSSRMSQYGHTTGKMQRSLASAKKENFDLAILAGDIINYPSEHNVEMVKRVMDTCGVPCLYIAGNHDWHFEGDPGPSMQLRDNWIETSLKPLYYGENPMIYSKVIKGVKFVMLDNSTYELIPSQLEAMRKELAEGLPTIICCHIPFYFPSRGHTGTGDPRWGAAIDKGWKAERRQQWSEKGQSKESFIMRDEIFAAPNVLGVFAGHTHTPSIDTFNGKFQIVTDAFFKDSVSPIKINIVKS